MVLVISLFQTLSAQTDLFGVPLAMCANQVIRSHQQNTAQVYRSA